MRRLLQQLQQRWLLRSPAQELRTVPTSFGARPCFLREPLLPLPPPLPAPARAQWRLDWSIWVHFLCIDCSMHVYSCHRMNVCEWEGIGDWLCSPLKEQWFCSKAVNFPVDYLVLESWHEVDIPFPLFTGSFHFINRGLWPSSQAGTSVR